MRADGKVDISCPQCGAPYRIDASMLDDKIKCADCQRVFTAKANAGRRAAKPDYTKMYVGFGVGIVAIILIFVMSGKKPPKPEPKPPAKVEHVYGRGDHPRAIQLSKWAQSLSGNNQLVMKTHSDLPALGKQLGVESTEPTEIMKALQEHESTDFLRTMDCSSAELDSEADFESATGSGKVYVVPRAGEERFKRNTNGIFAVTFRMDGNQVKVMSFQMTREPIWAPGKKPNPNAIKVNKHIERPDEVTITDSAGTRKVQESKPTPMPHWDGATPEQRAMADKAVADILASAVEGADPRLFNRATLGVISNDDKKACFPRVLNAMYECYDDPNANHQKLILLTRALRGWSGYAVNYAPMGSGDDATDKKRRQSCIRQWFAFWWRYHNNWDEFFDNSENLEDDPDEGNGK